MRVAPGFFVHFTEFDSVKLEKMTVLQCEICFFGKHIDKHQFFRYNKTVARLMKTDCAVRTRRVDSLIKKHCFTKMSVEIRSRSKKLFYCKCRFCMDEKWKTAE